MNTDDFEVESKATKKVMNDSVSFVRILKHKNRNFKQIHYFERNRFACQETYMDGKLTSILFPDHENSAYYLGSRINIKFLNGCLSKHKSEEPFAKTKGTHWFESPNVSFYRRIFFEKFPELLYHHCGGQLRNPKTNENLTWEQTKTVLREAEIFVENILKEEKENIK